MTASYPVPQEELVVVEDRSILFIVNGAMTVLSELMQLHPSRCLHLFNQFRFCEKLLDVLVWVSARFSLMELPSHEGREGLLLPGAAALKACEARWIG